MKNSMNTSMNKKSPWLIYILIFLLFILIILNIAFGTIEISIIDFIKNINNEDSLEYIIFMYSRLPRIIACIVVGAALSVAGLLLQAMLNNSLASPGIIGINSGAGLTVVIASVALDAATAFEITLFTFIGAFLSALLIYFLGVVTGATKNKLILAGIAISRLFSALSDSIINFYPKALGNRVEFNLGSLSNITNDSLMFASIIILIGLIGSLFIAKYLNIIVLGDDVAQSLGVNVKVCRFIILIIVALLCAGAVSVAGLLSFLGLIVPHIVRKLIGTEDHKRLVINTIIFGADLTLLCDLLSRTLFPPFGIPVGIIMSILGVPFFIILLFDKGAKSRYVKNK